MNKLAKFFLVTRLFDSLVTFRNHIRSHYFLHQNCVNLQDGSGNEDGSIVINLGVDEADKFSMSYETKLKGEKFVGRYDPEEQRKIREEEQSQGGYR